MHSVDTVHRKSGTETIMVSLIVKVPHSFRSLKPSAMARKYSSSDSAFKEIRIPVPWGHIAGKQWGPDSGRPVLGLHGWQDNCGTFDLLAPHLPEDVLFVAVDLPGHGLSSHIPRGFFYDPVSYVGYVRRATRHLGWDRFSLLGHSMGAMVGLGFAGCFPSQVSKMAVLDMVKAYMMPTPILASFVARRIDQMIDSSGEDSDKVRRTYTVDELVPKLLESTGDFMTEASARILLKRGTRAAGDRVVLTRDPRLRLSLPIATEEQMTVIRQSITCELLFVLANDGLAKRYPEAVALGVMDQYRKGARSVRMERVEGTHHVHLNNPERVAPMLREFFSS